MSDMNRRQFLSKLLPVLGAATVAPAVLIPERRVKRYWDMGAAHQKGECNNAVRTAKLMEAKWDPDTGLWQVAWAVHERPGKSFMNLRGVKRLSVADFKDIKRESGSILEGVDRLELPRKIEGLSRVQDGR